MKNITTLSIGLLFLVAGCLGFLGCSGNSTPNTQSSTTTLLVTVPGYSGATQANVTTAEVKPSNTSNLSSLSTLNPFLITAPPGYTLSVGSPTHAKSPSSNSAVNFNFNGINPSFTQLPIENDPDGSGDLLTVGIALLPGGQVTLTFPTIIMTPINQNNLSNPNLSVENLSVTFTVNTSNMSWSLPSTMSFSMNRLSTGYYTIGGSLVVAGWTNPPAASSCVLSGLKLYNSSLSTTTPVGTLLKSFNPQTTSTTIDIKGNATVPFNIMSNANFDFNP